MIKNLDKFYNEEVAPKYGQWLPKTRVQIEKYNNICKDLLISFLQLAKDILIIQSS